MLAGCGRGVGRQAGHLALGAGAAPGGLGSTAVEERVVFDGKIVTAAGVSSGIDMALTLLAGEAGERMAQTVQLAIEYNLAPPHDMKTPGELKEEALRVIPMQ
ncbi:hypothetical protein ACIBQ6_36870 [Nonomuraea sp. NPDC049655]|uniref:hypothetical protein n=1 Tax=Nonomuraea sp. NPDC049655 TaxID=3364355 RepID=UPI0037A96EF8